MNSFLPTFVWLCGFLHLNSAALMIRQGRSDQPQGEAQTYPVVGIATVEIEGHPDNRPTYYFDCVTDRNNGSGLRWTRATTRLSDRLEITNVHYSGSSGKRLNAEEITYEDLDVYSCSDMMSSDIISVNITDINPAIVAVKEKVEVMEGFSVELSIYVSGYPPPTASHITWRGPSGLDDEIIQIDEGVLFKDGRKSLMLVNVSPSLSGVYTCQVTVPSPPHQSAEADILLEVYDKPTISRIYPLSYEITEETNFVYVVPLHYVGGALVCSVYGWPTSYLEWYMNGLPLSDESGTISILSSGTASSSQSESGHIAAVLKWRREFSSVDAGNYQCVISDQNSSTIVAFQDIQIKTESMTEPEGELLTPCYVDQRLVYFQIRILGTDCLYWNRSQKERIAAGFHDKLMSEVSAECHCSIDSEELRVISVPQCSVQVEGGAVFHGLIQTNTLTKTEQIFCALSLWQTRSSYVLIDGLLQVIDTSCTMEATSSESDKECFHQTITLPEYNKIKDILVIVGVVGGIVMVIIFLTSIVCCGGCYCHHRQKRKTNHVCANEVQPTSTVEEEEHTYDQIDFSTKYGCNVYGPTSLSFNGTGDDLGYNTLAMGADTVVATSRSHVHWQNRPLPSPGSHPNSLIGGEFKGIGNRVPKLPNLLQAVDNTMNNANLYDHISSTELQLDKEEAQPYSEPVKVPIIASI